MVSVKAKQSTVVGTFLTIGIALITLGANALTQAIETGAENWYIGVVAILLGLGLTVADVYVLKSQENC